MTHKDRIRRSIKRVLVPIYLLGAALVITFPVLQYFHVDPFYLMLVCNPLAIAAIGCFVFIMVRVRCPKCQSSIGMNFMFSGIGPKQKWVNRDWGANFCPNCGLDLKQEEEAKPGRPQPPPPPYPVRRADAPHGSGEV